MARRILLLTNRRVAVDCVSYLQRCNSDLEVATAFDLEGLYAKVRGHEQYTRLISFLTDVIIPADVLNSLTLTPYNIHPGPPEYPGSHPEAFAIWDQADVFGVTAHEIEASVDSGAIVIVDRFPIPAKPDLQQLVDQVFPAAVNTFAKIATHCAHSDDDLRRLDERWGPKKGTRRAFRDLCQLGNSNYGDDFDRLKRACGPDLAEDHLKTA